MPATENHSVSDSGGGRKVEVDDLYRFRLLSDPQVSPDGRTVAYVQTRLRKKKNDYASNVWLVAADGSGAPIQFTASDKRDTYPRWSPKGDELAFLSTRSGKPQIWVIRVAGGEARRLTRTKHGVGDLAWSPDGRWLAFTTEVPSTEYRVPSEDQVPSEDTEELGTRHSVLGTSEEDEDKGDHAKVFTRLHFKEDGEGLVERRKHLFIVPAGGSAVGQLTDGDWDAVMPRWSPDGKWLAFLANREPDEGYVTTQDIFVMPINEQGEGGDLRRVTGHDAAVMSMDWLPSGGGFAAFAHRRVNEGGLATNPEVWAIALDGIYHNLTEGFDRPVGPWMSSDMRAGTGELRPRFGKDGSTIYFLVTNEGNVQVYSVPVAGGEVRQVLGGARQVLNFDLAPDGLVFAELNPRRPNDLFKADLGGGSERRLTGVNDDVVSALRLSEPREFWLDRPDGGKVHGWTLLPPDYTEGEKYPLILHIHGGPHMSYGNVYFHEFQLLAARGYIVLYTNPRGSQGYGQKFSDAILNDWGGIDYEDLMACVDYAISRGNVDENRLGVTGGSYGGYMSTWIIGHTRRFRAAVASRMVSNLYSAWGSGDFTWMLWSWEFEGMPQERMALYMERSPISHVRQIHTPLLITHAEDDHRTSIEQAEQMYTALKVLKREVKMVRLPSGGHDVSRSGKPSLRVERQQHILDWFEQHLG